MPLSMWYWVILILSAILWGGWVYAPSGRYWPAGVGLVTFILLVILGIAVFGGPIK